MGNKLRSLCQYPFLGYRCCRFQVVSLLMFMIATLSSCSQASPIVSNIDQTTPDATIRSMYDAFNRGDVQLLQTVLDMEAEENKLLVKGFKAGLEAGASSDIVLIEIQMVANDGRTARVHTRVQQKLMLKGQVLYEGPSGEWLTLVKKDSKWYIYGRTEPVSPFEIGK